MKRDKVIEILTIKKHKLQWKIIKLERDNARLEARVKNLEVHNAHQDNLIKMLTERIDIASERLDMQSERIDMREIKTS